MAKLSDYLKTPAMQKANANNPDVIGASTSRMTPLQQIQNSVQVSENEYYLRVEGKVQSFKNDKRAGIKWVGGKPTPILYSSKKSVKYMDGVKEQIFNQWGSKRGFITNVFFEFKAYYKDNKSWCDDPAIADAMYDCLKGIVIKDDDPVRSTGKGSTKGIKVTQHLSKTGEAHVEIFMEVQN